MWDEVRVLAAEQRIAELERMVKLLGDWHNTMHSPLHKKLWWWLQGYCMFSLGTWYSAPWNKHRGSKYNGVAP